MKRIGSSVAAVALAVGLGSAASAEPFNGPFLGVQDGWSQDDLGPLRPNWVMWLSADLKTHSRAASLPAMTIR